MEQLTLWLVGLQWGKEVGGANRAADLVVGGLAVG